MQHIAECHDPLAAILRERGEKTVRIDTQPSPHYEKTAALTKIYALPQFACHLSSCPGKFTSPKARRLHLIDVHAYPKEYFFAVTNKGIGGLLRRWGDGASLLRGPWRARDVEENIEGNDEEVGPPSHQSLLHPQSDLDGEGEAISPNSISTPDQHAMADTMDDGGVLGGGNADAIADAEVDALTGGVSALSLVPSSIRFGRGGPAPRGRAGLATRNGRPAGRSSGRPPVANHHHVAVSDKGKDKDMDTAEEESNVMEQDTDVVSDKTPPARGRRGRGRGTGDGRGRGMGRGRGFVPPPPRGGFLLRGAAGRGFPRGLIAMRARGRGVGV